MHNPDLVAELKRIVGYDNVLTDPSLRAGYEADWTGRYRGEAVAVVRPGSTEEIAGIIRACRASRVPLVPQGGNTGLVGGGVPRDGAVLLSLGRFTDIEPVDVDGMAVVAAAGATLGAVRRAASEAGLAYGVDLAARDSATIGGTIATNAGGIHVFRNGMTRDQVLGIEAVLGDGTIVSRLDAPRKDNTGYALGQLLAGSEGTLGIVTAARLRLLPRLDRRVAAFIGVGGMDEVVAIARQLRRRVPSLDAAEVIMADALELAVRHGADRPLPERHAAYLLVEVAGVRDPGPDLLAALAAIEGAGDAVVAADFAARDRLWRLREHLPEAISREGVAHAIDVAFPLGQLATVIERLAATIEAVAPGATAIVFGHLLDGNLHINVLGLDPDDPAVDDAVLGLALELGGTVSAEHGIGVAKAGWLTRDRSGGDLAAMRSIKRALDPDGILNPGVLLA